MLTSMTTRTLMPPGFTVSWQPTHTDAAFPRAARASRPAALLTRRETVALWPASQPA